MLVMPHDWFANLMGFREEGYDLTRSRLRVEDTELVSTVNDKRYGIGDLSLPTLAARGKHLLAWSWRRLTRRRCWRQSSNRLRECRTSCC